MIFLLLFEAVHTATQVLLSGAIFGESPSGMTKLKKDDTFCANVVVGVVVVVAVAAVVQGSGIVVSFVAAIFQRNSIHTFMYEMVSKLVPLTSRTYREKLTKHD